MRDQQGQRYATPKSEQGGAPPDLTDPATVGLLLDQLIGLGVLSDVVRLEDGWAVAVGLDPEGGEISGYGATTLGEAVAWALLATWQELESPSA